MKHMPWAGNGSLHDCGRIEMVMIAWVNPQIKPSWIQSSENANK